MACPYCRDTSYSLSFLPSTLFNNKLFRYLKCNACEVVYIDPLPDNDDYFKMYPPNYQGGCDKTIFNNPYKKLPGLRVSYGMQFDIIRKHAVKNPKILDYGCGNANFIVNACNAGFICDGAEFNEDHVKGLKTEFPAASFFTISELLSGNNKRYDVIRMSNVLEHLSNPNEIISILISKLNPDGVLLVEGPLEYNPNLAFFTRKLYFKIMNLLRGGYVTSHPPTHITFTNAKNQRSFFEKFKLGTLEYKIAEAEWPYPSTFSQADGITGKLKVCIAKLSMFISSFTKTKGNFFLYVGGKK